MVYPAMYKMRSPLIRTIYKLLLKGFAITVYEVYDHWEHDETHTYRIINGKTHMINGFVSQQDSLYDLRWILAKSTASELMVEVFSCDEDNFSEVVWHSRMGYSLKALQLLRPAGLKDGVIESMALALDDKIPATAPLKVMAALTVRDKLGLNALLDCYHVDYETLKLVLKPVAWWV
jgi:hypothetical protein